MKTPNYIFRTVGGPPAKPRFRRAILIPLLLALLGLAGFTAPAVRADPGISKEYEIKAVFLLNFIQFTDWPESAFASSNAPLRIGVLGDDAFAATVEKAVRGEAVRGHKIAVMQAKKTEELKDCQAVFVGKSERPRNVQILAAYKNLPVLTVGESEDFATQGGIFNFFVKNSKVHFEVNAGEARRKGLRINAQLFNLGVIVETKED